MRILIMGQPRSGKSTLSKLFSEYYNIPIICTDKLRREWGFHEPWKGFSTEINFLKQNEFYKQLLDFLKEYDSFILEGSAINPKDKNIFSVDINILLGRKNLSVYKWLELSRLYDNDWTSRRSDKYLLKLFNDYKRYSLDWMRENQDIYYDTSNYSDISSIFNYFINEKEP